MTTLTLCRGLPGSGKTTWARTQPGVAISRDELRRELYPEITGQDYYHHEHFQQHENSVTQLQRKRIRALLEAGISVVVHDTNLVVRRCRELMRIAEDMGAEFVEKRFDEVPVQLCYERQKGRPESEQVPGNVIQHMCDQFFPLADLPATSGLGERAQDYSEVVPYIPPSEPGKLPLAVVVDIDGTVATMTSRGPHDYDRVGEDEPNEAVIRVVRAMYTVGYRIILVSGRTDRVKNKTIAWLLEQYVPFDELHMRADGDNRVDWKVKYDLFNEHIRDKYDVAGAFDDRNQVVTLWRKMGITCFQVAEGDF